MTTHVEEKRRSSGVRAPGKFLLIQGPRGDVANQSVTQRRYEVEKTRCEVSQEGNCHK